MNADESAKATPAAAAGTTVLPPAEKARIQSFLDARYTTGDVRHSFYTKFGETIDCVDFFAQAGVKELARRGTPITELPAPAARPKNVTPDGVAFDGALDEQGNSRECSNTTVPHVRLSADVIEKAGGLDAYLAGIHKVPYSSKGSSRQSAPTTPGSGGTAAPDGAGPSYAHAQATSSISSVTSDIATLSIWKPTVTGGGDHSLAQTWTVGSGNQWKNGPGGSCGTNCEQTVEAGWTVDPGLFGTSAPILFTYATADGYQDGCYDGTIPASLPGGGSTCIGWVGTPGAPYALGQALPPSVAGSTPTVNELTVKVALGSQPGTTKQGWGVWVGVNAPTSLSEIGYYAAADFGTGPLATAASVFTVGGEVDDQTDLSADGGTDTFKVPMGSGALALQGWGEAAYVHDYAVNLTATGGPSHAFSAPWSTVPAQYAVWSPPLNDGTTYSPASGYDWANAYYFGAAGGTQPKAPQCQYSPEADTNMAIDCVGGNPGDETFVFQLVSGAWQVIERGVTGQINISEPSGSTLTFLACTANASSGLFNVNGVYYDNAPVGPGYAGCDATSTIVEIPVCVPFTCAELCGTVGNGCGGTLYCGTCSGGGSSGGGSSGGGGTCPRGTYKCGAHCC